MSEATWFLGPLGDLRALPCPDRDPVMTVSRYGGIHQGLSGARTMDVTGHRAVYEFEFSYLERSEYAWLYALHTRVVPGPFRLIDPMFTNRLTLQCSQGVASSNRNSGIWVDVAWSRTTDYPSAVGIPGRSIKLSSPLTGTKVRFDHHKPTAIFPAESITGSVYMRAGSSHQGSLRFDYYDKHGAFLSSSSSASVTVGTGWDRYVLSRVAPTNAAAAVFYFTTGSASTELWFAAPQFEAGLSASDFTVGGGAPVVEIDELPTSSPRFPLRDCSLTLLEV